MAVRWPGRVFVAVTITAGVAWGPGAVHAQPGDRHLLTPTLRPNLVSVTEERYSSISSKPLVKRGGQVIHYNRLGEVSRREQRDKRGRPMDVATYRYDKHHRLIHRTIKSAKRTTTRRYRYTLDSKQRVSEVRVTVPWRHKELRHVYIYDAGGKLRIREHDRGTGKSLDKNEYYRGSRSYDAQGRRVSRCSNALCVRTWYDAKGNLAGQRDQSKDTHYHRSFKNTYDAAGRLQTAKRDARVLHYSYNARGDVSAIAETIRGRRMGKRVYTYRYRRRGARSP